MPARFALARLDLDDFLTILFNLYPTVGPLLFAFVSFNLVLGLFNLLPIPPLDGGRIAVGLLPAPLAARYARLERAGILIVLLVVFVGPRLLAEFGVAFDPVHQILGDVLPGRCASCCARLATDRGGRRWPPPLSHPPTRSSSTSTASRAHSTCCST